MQIKESSILILEDEPEILNILRNIFARYFTIVHTATNGKDGLSLLHEHDPDLILTDISMPEVNGVDFVRKLRADGRNNPVIMVSSSKDREHLTKALKLGVQDFVEKPFKRADVEMAVFRVLEMNVRKNDLANLISVYGEESKEVKRQLKFIGLLQAVSTQV